MNIFDFNSNINLFKQRQDENELAHYGTRGQKWGVRKWQNYDGTFNEAGKIRYFGKGSSEEKQRNKIEKRTKRDVERTKRLINRYNRNPFRRKREIKIDDDVLKDYYEVMNSLPWYKRTHKEAIKEYKKRNNITIDDEDNYDLNLLNNVHDVQRQEEINRINQINQMNQMNQINQINQMQQLEQMQQLQQLQQIEQINQINQISQMHQVQQMMMPGFMGQPEKFGSTGSINWKQLDESNHDSYGKSEEQYWKDKEKAEKYLDENYDKDFAQVIKDDYDTGGEWGDVDAAYEQFKQNPYEYLKKYSRDPKYNLSPKEEKALQKEADKIDKAFAKGDIGTLNLLQSDKTEQIRKEANESFNKNCSEELNKLKDLYKDYDDNSEYYCALTALANSLVFSNTKVRDMANMIHGYVYDDFDQGTGSSGHVYLLDKGYSKDDMTNMCKANYENNEKFKNDIDLSISKDPLIGKTNERVRTQLRNALHNGSRSNLINKDANDYDVYSYRLQESGDTNADYSNRIKQNLPEAKKIINKVYKTCSNKEYGWWYLNQAINELGYSDVNYKDLTDSDWNKINAKIRELG